MFDLKEMFSNQKRIVGLDIGSSSIKLAEIQETSKGFILNKFSQISLPKGVIVDGVLNDQEALSAKIKELFKMSGCHIKGIATSLSGHSVIVKKVSFATMEEEELRELIRDEAGKYLPFDSMEGVFFDFQIIGENEYNPNLMEVMLVAAKKDIIDSYTWAITNAGMQPIIMDVDSFALETMYEENYDFEEGDVAVLVNIGASITNINVVKNGMSIFTRDFTLGGNSITEAIQSKLSVSFEEAEKIKVEGIPEQSPASPAEPGEGLEMEPAGETADDILSFAEPVCMEIERSVDYFRSTFGGEEIKQVLLSGGGAKIPGIAADIHQRLNIDTEIVHPLKKIGYNKKMFDEATVSDIGPIAAVAIGLGLRRVGDK